MDIVIHRVNSIDMLQSIPSYQGIEVDIRYHHDTLILEHDPFSHQLNFCESFENLLAYYVKHHTGLMILNLKTEGIEQECIRLMAKYHYRNWFFLDLSMPYFVKYARLAAEQAVPHFTPDNLAVRFSEFEPIEYALAFAHKVKWVWVDCFTQMPLDTSIFHRLKAAGFKLCLVAPELQQHSTEKTFEFQNILAQHHISLDAVCTKNPLLWSL